MSMPNLVVVRQAMLAYVHKSGQIRQKTVSLFLAFQDHSTLDPTQISRLPK